MSLSRTIEYITSKNPSSIHKSGKFGMIVFVDGTPGYEIAAHSTDERDYIVDKVSEHIQKANLLRIRCSSLAMRFYVRDGWTEELLMSIRSSADKKLKFFPDGPASQYWVADDYGFFNAQLLSTTAGRIVDYNGKEIPDERRLSFIEEMN